jgi:hypothetical protein
MGFISSIAKSMLAPVPAFFVPDAHTAPPWDSFHQTLIQCWPLSLLFLYLTLIQLRHEIHFIKFLISMLAPAYAFFVPDAHTAPP